MAFVHYNVYCIRRPDLGIKYRIHKLILPLSHQLALLEQPLCSRTHQVVEE